MTTDRTKQMADEMFAAIRGLVSRTTAPLEQRLAALEQRSAPDRIRDFASGTTYERGVIVRHGGQLWVTAYKTAREPGTGPSWSRAFLDQAR